MVQLQILSGRSSGKTIEVRHYPFCVGRSPQADLALGDPGLFDRHWQLVLNPKEGIRLQNLAPAVTMIADKPAESALLKNGDTIEAGSVKIRFWLAGVTQKDWRPREWFTWIALALLGLAQVCLAYWLSR